jgi:putative redox protein
MVDINIVYEGQLRCRAKHMPSGTEIVTDAPVDNHGKGEAFSPTDLLAAGLGSCILTLMGIVAERDKIDLTGTKIKVTKEMVNKPVRRIGKITALIDIPNKIAADNRLKLEQAAEACPVKKSLHPDIEILMQFNWS